jgi:hypothetical protein
MKEYISPAGYWIGVVRRMREKWKKEECMAACEQIFWDCTTEKFYLLKQERNANGQIISSTKEIEMGKLPSTVEFRKLMEEADKKQTTDFMQAMMEPIPTTKENVEEWTKWVPIMYYTTDNTFFSRTKLIMGKRRYEDGYLKFKTIIVAKKDVYIIVLNVVEQFHKLMSDEK